MMQVPLNAPWITELEKEYVRQALDEGWTTCAGRFVGQFEEAFARYVGRRYAVSCSSGTSALWLAFKAIGLQRGDRVLSQEYVCDAIAGAVMNVTGVAPLTVDVSAGGWNIVGHLVEEALHHHPDIRAVTFAHTYGVPAHDTEAIVEMCARRGVYVVEDGSEAHGAMIGSRRVGSFGDVSVFSLRGEKTLGAGNMGVLVTDDERIAREAHSWAHNGLPVDEVRFWSNRPGMNHQPANLHAALACAQLVRITELMAARNEVHARWRRLLDKWVGAGLEFQVPFGIPSWWLTGILLIWPDFTAMLPQDIITALAARGIGARPAFYGLSRLPHCADSRIGATPISDHLLRHLLILPSGPTLTAEQQEYTVAQLMDVIGR